MNVSADGPGQVLVVDDHPRARESMKDILEHAGHRVHACSSAAEALAQLDELAPEVLVTDLKMPGMDGLDLVREVEQRRYDVQSVVVTAHGSIRSAVRAMRHGAFDFVEKPFRADALEKLVQRALEHGRDLSRQAAVPGQLPDHVEFIGDSAAWRDVCRRIDQIAATDETVLVSGESGTGKELVARRIHAASARNQAPLISLNCPALAPQLMESELFGHERGAFTSADQKRVGRFELAQGGTILLDEVTEIDLNLQAKLLRVLQERTYERVGSSVTEQADVRVIATTNRDLQEEVRQGRFRADLYFRLAVVPIHVPPLRQRPEDVATFADHFLACAAERMDRSPKRLDEQALHLLRQYAWPGNVRELQNLMTRATVLAPHETIRPEDLRPWLSGEAAEPVPDRLPPGTSLQEMERMLIEATLEHFEGHRAKTAQALGIGVRTLANKLKGYGYRPRGKSPGEAA